MMLQIIFRRLGLEKQPWGGVSWISEKRIERVNDGDPGKTRLQPTAENGCRAGLDPARGIAGVAAGRGPCRGRRGQDRQNVHLHGSVPVSYTHLTLPTICSV